MNYAGMYGWEPNGYVSELDELNQNYYTAHGPQVVANEYSYLFPFNGRQNGDEHYKGNQYGYVPTEIEIASAIALRNMSALNQEAPYTQNDPAQNQLIQQMYTHTAELWQDIARYNGTWGVENY